MATEGAVPASALPISIQDLLYYRGVEEGRHLLVVWAHASLNRPHSLAGERAG